MHKLQQKILEMDFGKALKRWLILVICVLVFGGGDFCNAAADADQRSHCCTER
jgi:hypothetical protein